MTTAYKTRDEAEALWVIRDQVRFMGDVPGKNLSVLEVSVPPGSGTPPHKHESIEVFRILSGEITFTLFDTTVPQQIIAGPGSVLTLSPYQPHNYINTGTEEAEMIVIIENSMVNFFRDLGRPDRPDASPPSEAEIGAILAACTRHGIQVINF